MFSRLASVSLAVDSIDSYLPLFTQGLGLELLRPVQTSQRGYDLRWAELGNSNGQMLELIEPTSEASPVSRFMARGGGTNIYQLRWTSPNVRETLQAAERNGVRVIYGPHAEGEPAIGWIHPSQTGGALIEVMEEVAE